MLFVTYWKLNEGMSLEERQEAATTLVDSEVFPPENVDVLRWDGTADGWGVLVAEAESAQDIMNTVNIWRAAAPGFFETTKTAPAQPIQEILAQTDDLLSMLPAE